MPENQPAPSDDVRIERSHRVVVGIPMGPETRNLTARIETSVGGYFCDVSFHTNPHGSPSSTLRAKVTRNDLVRLRRVLDVAIAEMSSTPLPGT